MALTAGLDGFENTVVHGHDQPPPPPSATTEAAASGTSNSAQGQEQTTESTQNSRRQACKPRAVACRYIQQGKSCKAGNDCPFLHPKSTAPISDNDNDSDNNGRGRNKGRSSKTRGGKGKNNTERMDSVRKAQTEDLLRVPEWTVQMLTSPRDESAFAVEMKPSDPDFPYEVSRLYMALVIPSVYPARRTSDRILRIEIANKNIPVGIKRNVENGFSKHVRKTVNAAIKVGNPDGAPSLVDYIIWLDKNLEQLMQQKAAPTIKFTTYIESGKSSKAEEAQLDKSNDAAAGSDDSGTANEGVNLDSSRPESRVSQSSAAAALEPPASRPAVRRPVPKPLLNAMAAPFEISGMEDPRRATELSQLERRFRGSYAVSRDIQTFNATLSVSRKYPQGSPALTLNIDSSKLLGRKNKPSTWQPTGGRQAYLDYFGEHVVESPGTSILHHLNWLDRQLAEMLSSPPPAPAPVLLQSATSQVTQQNMQTQTPKGAPSSPSVAATAIVISNMQKTKPYEGVDAGSEKPWIKTISMAEAGLPEQLANLDMDAAGSDDSDDDSLSDSDSDSAMEGEGEIDGESETVGAFSKPIRMGRIQLTNVSLAHCHSLNLTVRCGRCRSTVELKAIEPTRRAGKDQQMWKACDTCTSILGVRFRPDWLFSECTTIGYLDCSSCAPIDLLPSKFTLSCEPCAMNDEGVKPVDTTASVGIGATTNTNCRTCYARLGMELHEPHFVQLQSGLSLGGTANSANMISREVERTRRTKVNKREELARLGVVPGQPLPDYGACKHFRRSKRWLRFPCCGKTYPCVTCHDDKEDHDYEYAQIMICGNCAKEQRISKSERTGLCISCGAQVIRKVDGNNAFWQGGTGVRDRTRMSRKDPKKFQGTNKTVALKKVATPKK
ncbi:hypothetical protein BX661DRAFT_184701 [Kickxella alabastrina]|uniref:uncharacterized protein n=1 Tax=Kickxella alabastrina TaxID=61397 RepID=UPI0022205558|nr:uncharacterized protein BX661DRAFT_184701 [Kickxella alabastrina]KAI7825507.1 hypothetical protein BX661DRAFT_184701 [Kickxella alabastrina]